MAMDAKRPILVRVSDVSVEILDEHGHFLGGESEAYRLARSAIDAAVEVGGGDAYHPSDGDTYVYEPRDPAIVVGTIVTMFVQAGLEVRVEQGIDDDAETGGSPTL